MMPRSEVDPAVRRICPGCTPCALCQCVPQVGGVVVRVEVAVAENRLHCRNCLGRWPQGFSFDAILMQFTRLSRWAWRGDLPGVYPPRLSNVRGHKLAEVGHAGYLSLSCCRGMCHLRRRLVSSPVLANFAVGEPLPQRALRTAAKVAENRRQARKKRSTCGRSLW